jgi:hypothetical protein
MDENARAALLISQSIAAMITAMGMAAENQRAKSEGMLPAYGENHFAALPNGFGIDFNSATNLLQGR